MTSRILTPAEANADPALRALYESAFPDEERIPWDDLLRLVREMPLNSLFKTGVGRAYGPVAMTILLRGNDIFTQSDYSTITSELFRFWNPLPRP